MLETYPVAVNNFLQTYATADVIAETAGAL